MNKKIYQSPTTICIAIEQEQHILAASAGDLKVDNSSDAPSVESGQEYSREDNNNNIWNQGW